MKQHQKKERASPKIKGEALKVLLLDFKNI